MCSSIKLKEKTLDSFFPVIYAKSGKDNALMFNIKSMALNSVVENTNISEYEAKYDHNMTKLFQNISLLAKNSDLVKKSERYKREDQLNIPALYKRERRINRYINNSKY